MPSKKHNIIQQVARPGEGVAVGIVRQKNNNSDGGISNIFSIDMSTAPVPDRRYAAEVGAIVMSDCMVRLLFGQTKPIGKGLSSMLVIHIPYRAARTFLNSMGAIVANARVYMKRFGVETSSLLDLKSQEEPAQTATVEANIIVAAFSGREACLDFYHSSPFALHGFGITGKYLTDPTVRVTLGLPLLMAIYDWFETHKGELPADELEEEL